MTRPSFLVAALAAFSMTACGSVAVEQTQTSGTGGAGGGAGSGTTTGTGGASSTTTTTTTTTTTSSSTTSTGGMFCGGKGGLPCPPDQWCHFAGPTPCGIADGGGTCEPKPQGCPADCPGVCGCDGQFYCNACVAQWAGLDVNPDLMCAMSPDTYRAVSLFTNLPRYAILKASPSRNLCFRLTVEMSSGGGGIGIMGDGWVVTSALETSDVNDCDYPAGPPPPPNGAMFSSDGADGALTFVAASTGCTTGIQAEVGFSGAPPWATTAEGFSAMGLLIEGGCP